MASDHGVWRRRAGALLLASFLPATCSDAVRVDVTELGHVVRDIHDVFERLAAPIRIDVIGEFLAVSDGSPGIWHDNDITGARKDLRVPAIAP